MASVTTNSWLKPGRIPLPRTGSKRPGNGSLLALQGAERWPLEAILSCCSARIYRGRPRRQRKQEGCDRVYYDTTITLQPRFWHASWGVELAAGAARAAGGRRGPWGKGAGWLQSSDASPGRSNRQNGAVAGQRGGTVLQRHGRAVSVIGRSAVLSGERGKPRPSARPS